MAFDFVDRETLTLVSPFAANDEIVKRFFMEHSPAESGFNASDPRKWYRNWYLTIDFCLGLGKTFEELLEQRGWSPQAMEVMEFLHSKYYVIHY
jgi:hypothetical protein